MNAESVLYEFPVSHFCEKARWALDHHGVAYRAVALAPGLHQRRIRRVGGSASTVPVWVRDGRTIQGTAAIIDALDADDPARSLTPMEHGEQAEARRLEAELDDAFGRDLRAVAYADLLAHPATVVALWGSGQPFWVPLFYRAFWPQVSLGLKKLYRLRPANVDKAKASFDASFDALDARLSDGRQYLVGDRLTRADIAACALLSPMVMPAERPWQPPVALPSSFEALRGPYRERPTWQWVLATYQRHRRARGTASP